MSNPRSVYGARRGGGVPAVILTATWVLQGALKSISTRVFLNVAQIETPQGFDPATSRSAAQRQSHWTMARLVKK